MGLEKLLRGLYGTDPQIDLDRQIARVRIPRPMTIDFAALARGVKENNMGLGGFTVTAEAAVEGTRVRLVPTGQEFRQRGVVPAGGARRLWKVYDWNDPANTALEAVAPTN